PEHNFASLPPIRSARPLWDLSHVPAARPVLRSPEPAKEGSEESPGDASQVPNDVFHRLPLPVLGTLVFIASEVMFFGALLAAFAWYAFRDANGPSPASLNVARTALFSLALFASSGTVMMAERRLHHYDDRGFRR